MPGIPARARRCRDLSTEDEMALRGKKPDQIVKRLKLFMFSPAGTGKTTAAIQFPRPYIIDTERGTDNYGKTIEGVGGAVFQTNDMAEVIAEVKALATTAHDYRTLVLDSMTVVYNDLLDKCAAKVGEDFGRHYGAANKEMKRLANLLMSLDMNVIVTAHAKAEYGPNLQKLGNTFDGWKQADYIFDLVLQLGRSNKFDGAQAKGRGTTRYARVEKTRIETFPDLDVFEWSYDAFKQRYDAASMERPAAPVKLASADQVAQVKGLLEIVRLPDDTVEKWFKKAGVEDWTDMGEEAIGKCIEYIKGRLPAAGAA
jgi:hypothetical protein